MEDSRRSGQVGEHPKYNGPGSHGGQWPWPQAGDPSFANVMTTGPTQDSHQPQKGSSEGQGRSEPPWGDCTHLVAVGPGLVGPMETPPSRPASALPAPRGSKATETPTVHSERKARENWPRYTVGTHIGLSSPCRSESTGSQQERRCLTGRGDSLDPQTLPCA